MTNQKYGRTRRERLFSRLVIDPATGCVVWTGPKFHDGYGQTNVDGRTSRVHRVIYEMLAGPIPEGLTLDHLCRNKICANVAHLEPVTVRENILRSTAPAAANFAKTHCPQGHPYDSSNTFVRRSGARLCRTCHRERARRYRAAARAKGLVMKIPLDAA